MSPLESKLEQAWPTPGWCDSHVVLAVSAGPDSVAMLRAAVAVKARCGGGGRLHVAHLNHALRGAESDADAAWLEALCRRLDVPLEIGQADVTALAAQQGDGLEAAARSARYDFLQHAAERVGARFVATAHTADDQVETVLHRVLRGTGLAGLTGIPSLRPLSPSVVLVRPLLAVGRREVLDYLAVIGQDFRTDPTNVDPRWTRNRLRHELLPLLRAGYNADVDAALLRLAAQAAEAQQLVAKRAAELARDCVVVEFAHSTAGHTTRAASRVEVVCEALRAQPPLLIREVCKIAWKEAHWPRQAMGFDEWQQLAELVLADHAPPAVNLPANVRARRDRQTLVLERLGLS